jgi:5-methylthioribose kinase
VGDSATTGADLSAATVGAYLRDHGVVEADADVRAEPLGGGVSNTVLRVVAGEDCWVVKQPLPNLAVEDDWPADVDRVHNEAAAARAYGDVVAAAGIDRVRVPGVDFEDRDAHVVGFDCVPEAAAMWKRQLLDRSVDASVAATLGTFLGEAHVRTAADDDLRSSFADRTPFEQLRVDPYHRTVAERHPAVAASVEAEIERMAGVAETLVHGDFSPKNVLVEPGSPPTLWVLDHEVAHWGDPAFDAAFMLNHLFIKSVYVPGDPAPFVDAARRFWRAYDGVVPWDRERETVRELAVLMLARVDGKSPVEYVTEAATKETLRSAAKRALTRGIETVDGYVGLLAEVDG